MEMQLGGGTAMLCTLDLEGRTAADPVADLLARRIVEYLASRSAKCDSRQLRRRWLAQNAAAVAWAFALRPATTIRFPADPGGSRGGCGEVAQGGREWREGHRAAADRHV